MRTAATARRPWMQPARAQRRGDGGGRTCDAVRHAGWTRQDRLVVEEASQVVGQLLGGGVPLRGLLGQALQADGLQVAIELRLEVTRRDRLVVDDLHQRVRLGRRLERRPPGEQAVENCPEGVDVGRRP